MLGCALRDFFVRWDGSFQTGRMGRRFFDAQVKPVDRVQNAVDRANVHLALAAQAHRHAVLLFVAVAEAAGSADWDEFVSPGAQTIDDHGALVVVDPASALPRFPLCDRHRKIVWRHACTPSARNAWRIASRANCDTLSRLAAAARPSASRSVALIFNTNAISRSSLGGCLSICHACRSWRP
jgi:hypothetical protein